MSTTRWPLAPQQEYMLANLAFRTADRAVRFRNPFLALRVTGPFDVDRFAAALGLLVRRHGVLRAELDVTTTASMRVRDELDAPLDVVTRCPDPDAGLAEQEWQLFDVGRAPLWRVTVFRLEAGTSVVSFAFCHLIWDGVSMRTFLSLLSREYADPGSTGPPEQYLGFAEAARDERTRRSGEPGNTATLAAVADAVRARRALALDVTALDLRRMPFSIGREGMDRWRRSATAGGPTPFLGVLRSYLTVAAAEFGRTRLITAFATSRLDLRPGEDSLGYFSDLSLAVADARPDTGGLDPAPQLLVPALSWSELVPVVGPVTYPQELYDVWARGPVFTDASDWAEVFPGMRTAVLSLTPGWRMPVADAEQRRILAGQIVPSLVVDDLRQGTGYLEFNVATVTRRTVRRLVEHFVGGFHDGRKD